MFQLNVVSITMLFSIYNRTDIIFFEPALNIGLKLLLQLEALSH
jgi:hypothetical protein